MPLTLAQQQGKGRIILATVSKGNTKNKKLMQFLIGIVVAVLCVITILEAQAKDAM